MTGDLFDYRPEAHRRGSDYETSHAAADAAGSLAKKHAAIILATLKRLGPMTSEAAATFSGLDHAQAWRRMSDLEHAGLIVKTGDKLRNRSGRMAAVWRAV